MDTYRIKITGFQKKITPEILAQILNEKQFFVNQSQDFVGYIGPLKTMKYARRLLAKWHNKSVDGQKLQCQIEWHQRSSMNKVLSRSESPSTLPANTNDSDSESEITVLDGKEFNYEARLYNRSIEDIIKQKKANVTGITKSAENLPLSADRRCTYIIISFSLLRSIIVLAQSLNELSEGSRKMTVVPEKTDHRSHAFLVEYNHRDEEMYRRELNVLQLLKGKYTNE
jgi:hypothetical protein